MGFRYETSQRGNFSENCYFPIGIPKSEKDSETKERTKFSLCSEWDDESDMCGVVTSFPDMAFRKLSQIERAEFVLKSNKLA